MFGHGISGHGTRRAFLPTTPTGRWAVALALAHVALMMSWRILPLGGWAGLVAGAAAGATALVAIRRHGERALSVLAAAVPLALVVVFVLAELLIGHE